MSRLLVLAALLGGCVHLDDPSTTSTDNGALEVTLANAPSGIDCINLSFADEDGVTTNVQRALGPRTLVVHTLAAGAYSVSAQAYGAGVPQPVTDGDCSVVPLNPPWGTEQPATLVIQPGERHDLQLTLVQLGRGGVTPVFADTPRVIAQAQGALGLIASGGGVVTWIVAGNSTNSAIVAVDDVQDAIPQVLVTGQTNPGEIVIDPATHNVFWTNNASGARDGDGQLIPDGSVWEFTAAAPQLLFANILPSDIGLLGDGRAVWGDFTNSAVNCSGCAVPLATGQDQPNAVGVHGNRVYWDNGNTDDMLAMNLGDLTPTVQFNTAPRIPIGITADDQFVYWTDFVQATGLGGVWRAPTVGGAGQLLTLVDNIAPGFPVAVLDGFVYWSDGGRIARVPTGGGASEDVFDGPNGGFALDHDGAGHGVIYWTDNTHGGLVWRGRVN